MLNPKQEKAVMLMALGEKTQKEIAKEINITEKTLSAWKKLDCFMAELERLTKLNIQSLASKALKTHDKLLNARSEMVQYLTAKDILDRAGYKAAENINVESKNETIYKTDPFDGLTTEELKKLANANEWLNEKPN